MEELIPDTDNFTSYIIKGKRHGKWVGYYDNPRFSEIHCIYNQGILDGRLTRFTIQTIDGIVDKTIELTGYFINGKKDGIFTTYYANGKKKSQFSYKNNQLDGLSIEWFENGKISVISEYKQGKLYETRQYYETSKIKGWENTSPFIAAKY